MRSRNVQATFNYLYDIRNRINGKLYRGAHSTNVLEDGYMGSGRLIKAAIKKYGKENFEKECFLFVGSAKELYEWEALLVDQDFIDRPDTYNTSLGGYGFQFGVKHRSESIEIRAAQLRGIERPEWVRDKLSRTLKGIKRSPETRKRMSEAQKRRPPRGPMTEEQLLTFRERMKAVWSARRGKPTKLRGQKCSEEHKRKVSEAIKAWHLKRKNVVDLGSPAMVHCEA